jgi:hypothetical protein
MEVQRSRNGIGAPEPAGEHEPERRRGLAPASRRLQRLEHRSGSAPVTSAKALELAIRAYTRVASPHVKYSHGIVSGSCIGVRWP